MAIKRTLSSGYTLIEIIAVLSILTIMAVMAAPRLFNYDVSSKLAYHILVAEIRSSQKYSVDNALPSSVTFHGGTNNYINNTGEMKSLSQNIIFNANKRIEFNSIGEPVGDTSLIFTYGSESNQIDIEPVTGLIIE